MKPEDALAIALAMPQAASQPHFDRLAVKVEKGRIFATFKVAAASLNVMLSPDDQALFCESAPGIVAPLAGGWGRMGFVSVDVAAADEALVRSILAAAHRRAQPKPRRRA